MKKFILIYLMLRYFFLDCVCLQWGLVTPISHSLSQAPLESSTQYKEFGVGVCWAYFMEMSESSRGLGVLQNGDKFKPGRMSNVPRTFMEFADG